MLKANSGEGRWWPELAHPEGTFARERASMSYERFCQMSSKYPHAEAEAGAEYVQNR